MSITSAELDRLLADAQTDRQLALCPCCGEIADEDHTTSEWADGSPVRAHPWICLRCAESRPARRRTVVDDGRSAGAYAAPPWRVEQANK